jgi:hypothetical protein
MRILILPLILLVAACASGPGADEPDFAPLSTTPLLGNGRLVLDCVQFAIEAGTVVAVRKDDAGLIRFTCDGPVAKALFDGLAERSARLGSEWTEGDGEITARATERINEDLYGVDVCRSSSMKVWCEAHFNVGDFMFD